MVYTTIDLAPYHTVTPGDDRFGAGGTATGGTVESVQGRYDREEKFLKDDRKVRGYDMRTKERHDRDFVNPATITVTSTTAPSTIKDGGVVLYDTDTVVTGTVGTTGDNNNGTNVTALKAELPNRGEAY